MKATKTRANLMSKWREGRAGLGKQVKWFMCIPGEGHDSPRKDTGT